MDWTDYRLMLRRQHFVVSGVSAVAGGEVETGLVTGQSSPFAKHRVKDEHALLFLRSLYFGFVAFWWDKLNRGQTWGGLPPWFQMPDPFCVEPGPPVWRGRAFGPRAAREGKGLHQPGWFITWVIGSDWGEIQMNSLWQAHVQTHVWAHAHKLIPGLNRLQGKRTRAGDEDVIKRMACWGGKIKERPATNIKALWAILLFIASRRMGKPKKRIGVSVRENQDNEALQINSEMTVYQYTIVINCWYLKLNCLLLSPSLSHPFLPFIPILTVQKVLDQHCLETKLVA